MRAFRKHPVVAVTTALVVLAAVAGPVQAGPPVQGGSVSWLAASPTASPIPVVPGVSVPVTITNTDRRLTSGALTVTLATSPALAPFTVGNDGCTNKILRPGESCTVAVGYAGPQPTTDHLAKLTVASGKPAKASVSRIFEVGVSFADVCAALDGSPGHGGTITVLGITRTVGDRCDWDTTLTTAVYNAAFDALSAECFDLSDHGTLGYTVTAETGKPAIGCVAP